MVCLDFGKLKKKVFFNTPYTQQKTHFEKKTFFNNFRQKRYAVRGTVNPTLSFQFSYISLRIFYFLFLFKKK